MITRGALPRTLGADGEARSCCSTPFPESQEEQGNTRVLHVKPHSQWGGSLH